MKTIFGILAGVTIVALVSSCDLNKLPEFDDNDAFAAFESTSYTVNEDVGSVTIPVTVASVAGLSTTVTYATTDGSAVYGTNYKLADESGVLVFDSNNRTQYITVYITDINDDNYEDYGYESSFTGTLSFTINLVSGGSVNLGLESSCTVSINDLNHPLADIIGNYQGAGYSGRYGDTTWSASMYADETNTEIIWIHGLDPYMTGVIDDVYATVSEDHHTLSIAIPAWAGTYGGDYICYCFIDAEGYYYPTSTGTLEFVYDGEKFVSEDWGYMVLACEDADTSTYEGYYEYVFPPVTFTKID